jgi:peptide/nickel transport system substrate-binding protein
MEGEGSKSLPQEKASAGVSTKMIAAVVVVILLVAGIGGALLLMGGKTEVVNSTPTAAFTVRNNVTLVNPGVNVVFNGTGSSDADGKVVEYWWSFGDSMLVTYVPVVTHAYPTPGDYIVGLQVRDDKGSISAMSSVARLTVASADVVPENGTAPVAVVVTSADATGRVVNEGATVTLSGNASWASTYDAGLNAVVADTSAIDTYSWNIGSTNMSSAAVYNYKFWKAGIYGVLLTVTNGTLSGQYMVSIQVKAVGGGGAVSRADQFIHAASGEPQTLDPAWDYESTGGMILQNCYDTLLYYKASEAPNMVLEPRLATEIPTKDNGGVSADGLNYTFHIRQGVKFHDGTTMTADDVVYSMKRLLLMNDAEGPAWMYAQLMLPTYPGLGSAVNKAEVNASVIKVDDNTVTFKLFVPYAGFLNILTYSAGSVSSKAYIEANGGLVYDTTHTNATHAKLLRNNWMNRHVMGTGPYMLKDWIPNNSIICEKFDNCWRGQAHIKYFIYQKAMLTSTRVSMLNKGSVDSIQLSIMYRDQVESNTNLRVHTGIPTLSVAFFGMNEEIIPTSGWPVGDIPTTFFADLNVRQAFVHAFDGHAYIRDVTLNTSALPNGPIPQGLLGYDPSIPYPEYNLTLSAEYLNKALDTRTTGDLTDTFGDNGFTIYVYYNAGNDARAAALRMLKNSLESLSGSSIAGTITVNIEARDWPIFLDARARQYMPLFNLGWGADYPDPDNFANPFLHEGGAFPPMIGLANHTLTAMIEDAAIESNLTIRAEKYSAISMACYENAYYIFLSQPVNFHVERAWVTGYYNLPVFSEEPADWFLLDK